jgi:hypothetical protein
MTSSLNEVARIMMMHPIMRRPTWISWRKLSAPSDFCFQETPEAAAFTEDQIGRHGIMSLNALHRVAGQAMKGFDSMIDIFGRKNGQRDLLKMVRPPSPAASRRLRCRSGS